MWMNTSAVAKVLGVSPRTVQRWVKQLGMQMERNESGHFLYSADDIEALKNYKDQIQSGASVQTITAKKPVRKASVTVKKVVDEEKTVQLDDKLKALERKIDGKADSVVTYQLLQHRNEIEELKNKITQMEKEMEKEMEKLFSETKELRAMLISEHMTVEKPKKKNIFSSIF